MVASFRQAYPEAEVLRPEGGKYPHSDVILITGVEPGGYATSHEAFSLVIAEVPLDLPANATGFLLVPSSSPTPSYWARSPVRS